MVAARSRALDRQGVLNARLPARMLDEVAPLTADAMDVLRALLERDKISARGYHRLRRVARTIDDLEGREGPIGAGTIESAMQLRATIEPVRARY